MENFGQTRYYIGGKCSIEDSAIEMKSFNSPHDFITMLHGIGHATDFRKKGIKNRQMCDEYYNYSLGLGARERNAWAEVFKIVRNHNLPILKNIKEVAQERLSVYQNIFGEYEDKEGNEKITHYEAVTDEERKKVRKNERKLKQGGTKIEN